MIDFDQNTDTNGCGCLVLFPQAHKDAGDIHKQHGWMVYYGTMACSIWINGFENRHHMHGMRLHQFHAYHL
ncbi:predicted protein [Lichtheimia corymbifera JMRC:FSU:9682]|uniref:Uncharacterized protein n=1 Tax=Lichtheimia corymbifera JMRC:FSU:9682 TaxID=1263082 RepID=A0A068S5V9_9FUNG|nr:predicted protein [Lichtheimia corymbifera JMRC:FSU:9682]